MQTAGLEFLWFLHCIKNEVSNAPFFIFLTGLLFSFAIAFFTALFLTFDLILI